MACGCKGYNWKDVWKRGLKCSILQERIKLGILTNHSAVINADALNV